MLSRVQIFQNLREKLPESVNAANIKGRKNDSFYEENR